MTSTYTNHYRQTAARGAAKARQALHNRQPPTP